MSVRNFWRNYFYFNRKERSGLKLLFIIAILLTTSLITFPLVFKKSTFDYTPYAAEIAQLQNAVEQKKDSVQYKKYNYSYSENVKSGKKEGKLFYFDPNTLSAEGWQELGLSEKQAMVIVRYTDKGGKFYKKEDLKKMMVITEPFYQRIESFIQISTSSHSTEITNAKTENISKEKITFSLNNADSIQLLEVNGIGEKLASRIVKYRERLGGFYSIHQLKEVYGIKDDNFQILAPQFVVNEGEILKININYCGWNELSAHPYVGKTNATAIIQYRNKNGTFTSVDALKTFNLLDSARFEKVKPYFIIK